MIISDEDLQDRLSAAVLAYLDAHPAAGDTAEGVLKSWLPTESLENASRFIDGVLDQMVKKGWLSAKDLPGKQRWYARGPRFADAGRSPAAAPPTPEPR